MSIPRGFRQDSSDILSVDIGHNAHIIHQMDKAEFEHSLHQLDLTVAEAAQLLSVSPRTVRRWAEQPADIPGPAVQAIRAWMRLQNKGLAWRPDAIDIGESDEELAETIAAHRRHAIELDDLLQRVDDRGGPVAPWVVDLERNRADLESISIGFYRLRNGSFSPAVYRRSDQASTDIQRDWPLIEDGLACIAKAIADES